MAHCLPIAASIFIQFTKRTESAVHIVIPDLVRNMRSCKDIKSRRYPLSRPSLISSLCGSHKNGRDLIGKAVPYRRVEEQPTHTWRSVDGQREEVADA